MSKLLTLNGSDIIVGVTVVDGLGVRVTADQTVSFAIKNRTTGKWWNTVSSAFDLSSEPALAGASQVDTTGIYELTLADGFDSVNFAFTVHIETTGTIAQDFYENEGVQAGIDTTNIADGVWSEELEGAYTAQQLMRLYAAAMGGVASGLQPTANVPVYRSITGEKARISAKTDRFGNRSEVDLDLD